MGAAAGSGFGLAAALYRYGNAAHQAYRIDGGWSVAASISLPTVPDAWTSVTTWLPAGASAIHPLAFHDLNWHLVWSALGGLAVGLIMVNRTLTARVIGACVLLYIAIDHASLNATLSGPTDAWLAFAAAPLEAMREWSSYLPLAALLAACGLDLHRQRAGDAVEPVLLAE